MKLRNKPREVKEISTASLPDIVFLLLFFFMVSATIKNKEDKVSIQYPQATAITQIEKKTLIREISVGIPKDHRYGDQPVIAVDDRIILMDDVPQWVIEQKETLPEAYKDQMIVLLRADELVKMGLVSDIQQQLKKADARKIVYRTLIE